MSALGRSGLGRAEVEPSAASLGEYFWLDRYNNIDQVLPLWNKR